MGNDESADQESFSTAWDTEPAGSGRLEYPQYTRPTEFRGWTVPEVLRSGDHGRIARWRRAKGLRRTLARRHDLLDRPLADEEQALLAEFPD